MAADLFVVPTATFRLLFVLVILAHDRRRIVHVAVTDHPTAAWTAQQLRNAFSENDAPKYLLHDRDSVFADVSGTIAGMNTAGVRTAPRSPWQNAYVERVIGSMRRECLDHVIVFNAAGRRRVHRVLPALANPSRAWQGRAEPASGHTAVSRSHRCHPRSRRIAPPLRSHRCVGVARRRSQTLLAVLPVRSTRPRCAELLPMSAVREQRHGTARTNTQVAAFEMECPDLVSTFQ
jgi:hypothetical protein